MVDKFSKLKVNYEGENVYWVVLEEYGDTYIIHQINEDTIELLVISHEEFDNMSFEKEKEYDEDFCYDIHHKLLENGGEIDRSVAKDLKSN